VDDEFIAASHVELFAFTGRPVIGVFHTLSAGNAGQLVPGSVVPATFAVTFEPDNIETGVALAAATITDDEDIVIAHTTISAFDRRRFARFVCIGITRFLLFEATDVVRVGNSVSSTAVGGAKPPLSTMAGWIRANPFPTLRTPRSHGTISNALLMSLQRTSSERS
jgi:hypothetical protein